MELLLLLAGLGLISGFLSGLLGIGGGIVMAPLLLYVPPLFGHEPLAMRVVAGLTIVQGLLGCMAGALGHKKLNFVSSPLSVYMGPAIFFTALIGGAGANYVPNDILLLLFAALAFAAALLMLVPIKTDSANPDVNQLSFSRLRAVSAASTVGLLGGMVGQGGSFILIPIMTAYIHIPTRIAIGSNLAIVLLSSLAGFIGKALTGQIAWLLCLPIALSVMPAAYLGSMASSRVPVANLRRLLAVLIGLAAIRISAAALL